ncbi:MAG: heme exporter protein CcmD [Magnetococcales bacterium]|nr:heme exporter protein CcmD [Magnetococcales bacterium]
MGDYSGYVTIAYGIALAVYGGVTLHWQRQWRRLQERLAREGDTHGQQK